ncbi:MAG: capsule biosynthesis GfcC family protein [Treponema sp.]|jgi:hypothetical protein|nr:capsule biosynthesis GfcC family protein [Treponema sp.]
MTDLATDFRALIKAREQERFSGTGGQCLAMFDTVAKDILAREQERIRDAARQELTEWEKDPEYGTEIWVLKKLLEAGGTTGRSPDVVISRFSDNPHPLSSFLAEHPQPPGTVSRLLEEVRRDYERLLDRAGEGGEG